MSDAKHAELPRSAKVVEDLEEIHRLLSEGLEKAKAAKGTDPSTWIRREEDGRTAVYKATPALQKQAGVTPEHARAMAEARGFPWEEGYENRLERYWASDERPDGHGDIVRQTWLFDLFEDNPVLAWSHQWGGAPIGGVLEWDVVQRVDSKYQGPALQLLALFATAEQWDWADTVRRLVRARFLRAGSVGFYADRVIRVEDDAERAELGLGRWGVILDRNHLLEFSPTLLGANPGAGTQDTKAAVGELAKAKANGLLKASDFELIRELARDSLLRTGRKDAWKELDRTWCTVGKSLFGRASFEPHEDVDQPFKPGEERILRAGVALAGTGRRTTPEAKQEGDERLQAIEDSLARVEAMLAELLTQSTERFDGLVDLLEGVLDLLGESREESNAESEGSAAKGPARGDGDPGRITAEQIGRLERALERLEQVAV